MQYLVKMTPLEPYCFGTDQSAPYIGAENGGKGDSQRCRSFGCVEW